MEASRIMIKLPVVSWIILLLCCRKGICIDERSGSLTASANTANMQGGFLDTSFYEIHDEAPESSRVGNVDVINVNGEDLGFCRVAIFLPYSVTWYKESLPSTAAALLAMNMLNNGDGSVVSEVQGLNETCPIRFTAESVDTAFDESLTMGRLLEKLRNTGSARDRKLCAILGPVRNEVSLAIGIVSSLQLIPQVSFIPGTTEVEDKAQYPYFARAVPGFNGYVKLVILYYKHMGIKHLGMIHWNDKFGNDYGRAMLQVGAEIYPELNIVAVDLDVHKPEYEEVITIMRRTEFRYFQLFVLGPRDLVGLLTEAVKQGIAANGEHTWFCTSAVGISSVTDMVVPKDSPLAAAMHGVGLFDGVVGLPGMPVFDEFQRRWRALGNDQDLAFLETKRTEDDALNYTNETVFADAADYDSAALFDATILLGLAACKAAANQANATPSFDAQSLYQAMLNTTFHGPSGTLVLDPITGVRNPDSARLVLRNFKRQDVNETHVTFEQNPSQLYTDGEWITMAPFVYNDGADGTTTPLPDLPPYKTDFNHIGTGLRAAGLCMAGVVWLLAIGFAGWTTLRRNMYVVKASQPIFLLILCVGTFITGTAIVPLSIDDAIASKRGCSIACMAVPWLTSTGFVMTFAALFSKTWRVNRIFNNPTIRRVKVTAFDVMRPLILLLGVNIVVLVVWTAVSPLEWTREVSSQDIFGRTTGSRGYCKSDHILPFFIIIVSVDIGALLFASYQSYLARHVSTEFAESDYIAKAIACMLLVSFVGLPTTIIVSNEPRARFFVLTSILFVLCVSVLLFIFIPKMMFARNNPGSSAFKSTVRSHATLVGNKHRSKASTRRSVIESSQSGGSTSKFPNENEKLHLNRLEEGTASPKTVTKNRRFTPLFAVSKKRKNTKERSASLPEQKVSIEDTMDRTDLGGDESDISGGIKVFNTKQKLAVLEAFNDDLQEENDKLYTENDALRSQNDSYRQRVSELEALLEETETDDQIKKNEDDDAGSEKKDL